MVKPLRTSKYQKQKFKKRTSVLLFIVCGTIFFQHIKDDFVMYENVSYIFFYASSLPAIYYFICLRKKLKKTGSNVPAAYFIRNPKDNRMFLYAAPPIIWFACYLYLAATLNIFTYFSNTQYQSYIIVNKSVLKKTCDVSRYKKLIKNAYRFDETLHFNAAITAEFCISSETYNKLNDISALRVTGKKSVWGHRIDTISYSQTDQNKLNELTDVAEKEWNP